MKVSVFTSLFSARIKSVVSPSANDIISIISDLIKPSGYLPYDAKIKLVSNTIEQVKDEEYPTPMRHRQFIINLINTYTSLEMTIDDFDVLSANNLLDPIISTFRSEYIVCDSLMKMVADDVAYRMAVM